MNRISFPRTGYDGHVRTKEIIEKWFWKEVGHDIKTNINAIAPTNASEAIVLKYLSIHLKDILLGDPYTLQAVKASLDGKYRTLFALRKKGSFNKKILNAFDYKGYRKNVLTTLAKYLDVKTCPYCNAQYTLFLDVRRNVRYPKGIAKFQFDHFFNKSDAPFLSMSLYNLIPSCASCNLSKHQGDLPVELNPYICDIQCMFKFRLAEPFKMWTGAKINGSTKVKLVPNNPADRTLVDTLNRELYLSKQYGRHWDVAQDVYDRAYTYPYYSASNNFENMLTHLNEDEFKRIWMGTSPEKADIENRPLTKFMQDLWEQANEVLGRKR